LVIYQVSLHNAGQQNIKMGRYLDQNFVSYETLKLIVRFLT